jgi:phospholipid/cholesterol/gamma-HCH transport system substrate-binding protein
VVGRVETIRLDPKTYEAVVRVHLENQYKFSRDTIATIYTSGLLGEQFVGLEAGGDSEMLQDEDLVKKTQSAIQIEKLISQFMFSKAQESPAPPATGAATPPPAATATAKTGAKP